MTAYWYPAAANPSRRPCGCCDWDECHAGTWARRQYRCQDHRDTP